MSGYGINETQELKYEFEKTILLLIKQLNKWCNLLNLDGKNTKKQVIEEMIEMIQKMERDI